MLWQRGADEELRLATGSLKPVDCLHYSLNVPVSVQINGINYRCSWIRRSPRSSPSGR